MKIWKVPEVILLEPKKQVLIACDTHWEVNASLNFTAADAQIYPQLQGKPRVAPRRPQKRFRLMLPDEAFASTEVETGDEI